MPKQQCTCGAKYRFDDSAIGKKARCKKCGRLFTITPDAPDGTIPLAADEGGGVDLATAVERSRDLRSEAPYRVGADPASLEPDIGSTPPLVDEPKPSRGYLDSLLWTLLFPTSLHNLISFCLMWGLLFVSGTVLSYAGCLGTIGRLFILGWYCAFRFETIAQAAAGKDDLPGFAFSEGVVDEVIFPLFKWLGTWALVSLPAIVYLFVVFGTGSMKVSDLFDQVADGIAGAMQGVSAETLTFVLLVLLGAFFWPMVALCVGLGGFEALVRVDLIARTMAKTFPIYLLTVGMVLCADLAKNTVAAVPAAFAGASILVVGVGLYCEIVAMRVIGLYYHHFKHRFAWDWG